MTLRRVVTTIIITVLLVLVCPVSVLAGTTADITITATGIVTGIGAVSAPSSFTVWYINDYTVGMSWVNDPSANSTIIRAKYGSYPTSKTDGYLVYSGLGTSTNDTAVNFDENAGTVYYAAYSVNSTGGWSPAPSTGKLEGFGVTLLSIIGAVLVLTVLAFVLKQWLLHAVGVVGWLVATYALFNRDWGTANTYMPTAVAFFGFTMVVVHAVMIIITVLGERKKPLTYEDEKEQNRRMIYNLTRKPEKKWYE